MGLSKQFSTGRNGKLADVTMMSWEEVDAKLKAIRDHVEKAATAWSEAAALREEIVNAGLPNGEFQKIDESKPLAPVDLEVELLHTRLGELGTALKAKNKSAVLENLSEAQKLVEVLRRRS